MSEMIKLAGPLLLLVFWVLYNLRGRSTAVALLTLFFATYAGFAQNFSLIYRELYQIVQITILLATMTILLRNPVLHRGLYVIPVFASMVLVSALFAPFDSDLKAALVNLTVIFGVLFYAVHVFRDEKTMQRTFRFVAICACLTALLGIAEFIGGGEGRAEATFSNPNYYGYFLGIGFCLGYNVLRGPQRLTVLGIIMLGILVSGSRAALLMPVIQVCWSVVARGHARVAIAAGVAGIVILAMASLLGVQSRSAQAQQASDAERILFALIGFRMATDHPWTGVGWGRFPTEFEHYSSDVEAIILDDNSEVSASSEKRRVSHNDLIRIMAELGFPALGLSLLFLIRSGLRLWKHRRGQYDYLFPVWAGTLLFSLTHNNLNTAVSWLFLCLPAFLLVSAKVPPALRRLVYA
jgi:O-antigen ligase